ncbi:hypothetical protein ACFQZC_08450 [Streptacidiphilus monticola]
MPLSWRAYQLFQRHPVLLARTARYLFSSRTGEARDGLGAALDAARVRQLVGELRLVEDALAGVRWTAPVASP